jgi:hypothetical protein
LTGKTGRRPIRFRAIKTDRGRSREIDGIARDREEMEDIEKYNTAVNTLNEVAREVVVRSRVMNLRPDLLNEVVFQVPRVVKVARRNYVVKLDYTWDGRPNNYILPLDYEQDKRVRKAHKITKEFGDDMPEIQYHRYLGVPTGNPHFLV